MRVRSAVLAVSLTAAACSKGRPLEGEPAHPVSWNDDVASVFATSCNSCHSGPSPAAGYSTASYLDALGPQSAPIAIAGKADSKLLQVIDPAKADAVHAPVSSAYDVTHAWVVEGKLALNTSGVHEGGILNPHDAAFHSNLVRDQGWNFAQCQHCHGDDLAGGNAKVSCQECHSFQVPAGGVPTCMSCHGSSQSPAPPRDLSGGTSTSSIGVGAHQAHLFGKTMISAPVPCSVCHQVPAHVDSPGHLDHPLPAVVVFSGLALADGAKPSWNGMSCSATYCHGGGAGLASDTAAALRAPTWTGGTSQAFCGSCHGVPPSGGVHTGVTFPNCAGCHPRTVDAFGNILVSGSGDTRTSSHMNGAVDVGP